MFRKGTPVLPFFIARRYFMSRKTINAINIISLLTLAAVTIGTIALITILSVFNGLDGFAKSLFDSFDPDLKITPVEGKVFLPDTRQFNAVRNHENVAYFTEVLEEKAMLKYADRQSIAIIKGVADNFAEMSGVDSMIVEGDFLLRHGDEFRAVIGYGIVHSLSAGIEFITPLNIYVPSRMKNVSLQNPMDAFNQKPIFLSGIFSIQQEFDSKYVFVPIDFARDLLNYKNEVTAIELKINPKLTFPGKEQVKEKIQKILGDDYVVKNRYEQHELLYKIMQSEKFAIFLILSFIILIASFNIIASITMLILDKKQDINILQGIGANRQLIHRIFFSEGWLISIVGAILGLLLGAIICFLQIQFGFIKLPGGGSFIIEAYPVVMKLSDFVVVFITVILIGFLISWLPTKMITRKVIGS